MSKNHNTNTHSIPQARLTRKQKVVIADLVHLLKQPDTQKNQIMIRHFWLTLPDRLTDQEYDSLLRGLGV